MKWTEQQISALKRMCISGTSNKDLAKHFGVPVTEIHAKRSQLGITIPKVKAAQGKAEATINPKFEAAINSVDEKLPVHSHHGLNTEIRERFRALQDAILLTMARNGTSPEAARVYNCLGQTMAAIESTYDDLLRDEEL